MTLALTRGADCTAPSSTEEDQVLNGFELTQGDLELGEVIGSGGFSEVWRGIYKPTNENVAIKKMHMVEGDVRAWESYIREVKMLAGLSHKAIVRFVGFTKQYPFYIVTSFISGGSLYSAIHNGNFLSGTEKNIIAYGVAAGMQYLHSHGVIHRDLKPQNVLLDDQRSPVICDLGSGRSTQEQMMMTNTGGTANYMAPEFLSSTSYDRKVDVYSYGLVLCEMLSGEIPFEGMESAQVIYSVFIRRMRPDIPESVGARMRKLIERCWAHDPAERPEFEDITRMFREKEVQFEGTDEEEFAKAISRFGDETPMARVEKGTKPAIIASLPKKKRKTSQRRDSLPVSAGRLKAKANTIQTSKPMLPISPRKALVVDSHDMEDLAQFEANVGDPSVPGEAVWPKLLMMLKQSQKKPFQRARRVVKMYTESPVEVAKLKDVSNLHDYVCPNTLDVFLCAVSYVPQVITDKVVSEFIKLSTDELSSSKAIVLLCKILQAQVYNPKILDFFLENAIEFADTHGGHLILRTLVRHDIADKEIVMAYAASSISANVVAAYEAVFSVPSLTPDCFRLDSILAHAMSPDFELRRESLEFIRRFSEAAAGEPLRQLCGTLFNVAIKYESDAALLLLCRIAKDCANCQYMLENKTWMKWKGSGIFLNLFLVVFSHERLQPYVMEQEETLPFLSAIVDGGSVDEVLGVSWVIQKAKVSADFAQALVEEGVVESICDVICESKHPGQVDIMANALSQIVRHNFVPSFERVVSHALDLVNEANFSWSGCIVFLYEVSQRAEARDCFLARDVKSVLEKYRGVHPEARTYVANICHNLSL